MQNKSPKLKILYFILYRIMDMESLLWDITEFIVKPIAKMRQVITNIIAKELNLK